MDISTDNLSSAEEMKDFFSAATWIKAKTSAPARNPVAGYLQKTSRRGARFRKLAHPGPETRDRVDGERDITLCRGSTRQDGVRCGWQTRLKRLERLYTGRDV